MSDPCAERVAELERRLKQRQEQIEAIHRISSALGAIVRQKDLVREALRVSMELVGACAGSIILYDPDRDKLVFTHVVGPTADDLVGMEMAPDRGIAGSVFNSGELRVTEDVTTEAEHDKEVGEKVAYQTTNMVTVPLKSVEGRPIGVMQVLNKAEGSFDEDDVEVLAILGSQIATAIETSRLHERARLAEVVQFVGHISHDVKNMVTPVQTGAETLQFMMDDMFARLDEVYEGASADPQVQQLKDITGEVRDFYPEMIDIILDGSNNVQARTKEISDCIKGMVSKPHFEPLDLRELVDRAVKPLQLVADSAGVALAHEPLGDMPQVVADEKQLYNAIYNLANNAIQACEKGDSVTIRTSAVPEGEWPDGGYALIEVVDTGSGIPKEVLDKLFTDDAVSTKPGGTGLGTRIIGDVVKIHGGTIAVDSEVGVGTTMSIRLPLTREEA
ncbi:MAG TPA: GAF domain-containing sensor histidine kinase [Armatimonadota bacterium]|nr:GAF domain-containing sensor histidine kinase [Armatimonadota bacterium]